jgi:hypothetical protein
LQRESFFAVKVQSLIPFRHSFCYIYYFMKINMKTLFLLPVPQLIKLMIFCGLVQIGAYYFVGAMASPGNYVAMPQPDTILYCQAARQISLGQPFIFTPGDKPSTGTTSHLYPFLLAIPYMLGATGDNLLTAGFALNAAFYLIFLICWALIATRLCETPLSRGVACLLLALNGQAAIGALSQTDTGLFMAVSAGLFATLLTQRTKTFACLLVLAPWCRPEGGILALLFPILLISRRLFWRETSSKAEWAIAAAGTLSTMGVPLFNIWLTGDAQFHSILYKGYFKQFDLIPALFLSAKDAIRMLRELFLGTPEAPPREFFFLPLFGAIFGWIGIWHRHWLKPGAWKELWWISAALAGLGAVATSEWQNTNVDRYLAWIFPIWLLYAAEGATWLTRHFHTVSRFTSLPVWALVGFQFIASCWMLCCFEYNSHVSNQEYDSLKTVDTLLPKEATIGSFVCPAYAIPGRRIMHLPGIYSPDFLVSPMDLFANLDKIKHEKELRFDYWLLDPGMASWLDQKTNVFYTTKTPITLDSIFIAKAEWSALNLSLNPLEASSRQAIAQWREIERIDIGYLKDEKRCRYSEFSRFYRAFYHPFLLTGKTGTNTLADVGRAILGSESMTLHVTPNQPLLVILRTTGTTATRLRNGASQGSYTFSFNSPLKLRIHIDEKEAGYFEIPIKEEKDVFSEIVFELPAKAMTQPNPRITIYGDHASFAYWFYQPLKTAP